MVGCIALSLAVAGKAWDKTSLGMLRKALDKMDPRDTMKRKGRMAQFTGPGWVSAVCERTDELRQFTKACELVGDFLTSASAERDAFHKLCAGLKSPAAKMFHIGGYGVPVLVRACTVARSFIRGDGAGSGVHPDADAWEKDLRDMHQSSTRRIFDMLAVTSYPDAVALQSTVRGLARGVWSQSIARHYASVSLVDLPCQACEFGGILGAVKSILGGGDAEAIRWLLARLPGDLDGLKAMGERLRKITAKTKRKGDGLDRQAAGVVTKAWLEQLPERPAVSMECVYTSGGGDMFGLPRIFCPRCSELLPSRRRGRKKRECDACYRARVRKADAERQAKKRRLQ